MSADFVSGATMIAAFVITLFFLRYWRRSGDRLFLIFSAGFFTFGFSRLILAFLDEDDEGRVFVYALRLLAFVLILAAIIDKNRSRARPSVRVSHNGYKASVTPSEERPLPRS